MPDFRSQLRAHEARAVRAEKNISAADKEAQANQTLLNTATDKSVRKRLIHVVLNAKWRARHNRFVLAAEKRRAAAVRKQIVADTGRSKTMRWALSRVGVVEHPPYSNSGPFISDWIIHGGGQPGYAWCQYFCDAGLLVGGGVQLESGYTPDVVSWAQEGKYGLKVSSLAHAKPGDFVYFKFPGVSSDPCDHVGLFLSQDSDTITCVEGNTSPGNSGSQYNGGGVFKRTRDKSIVAYVVSPTYAGDK
jgi:hypothetical protein